MRACMCVYVCMCVELIPKALNETQEHREGEAAVAMTAIENDSDDNDFFFPFPIITCCLKHMLAPQRQPTNRSSLSQANGEEGLTGADAEQEVYCLLDSDSYILLLETRVLPDIHRMKNSIIIGLTHLIYIYRITLKGLYLL